MCLLCIFRFSCLPVAAAGVSQQPRKRKTARLSPGLMDALIDFWVQMVPAVTTSTPSGMAAAVLKDLLPKKRPADEPSRVDADFARDVYLLGIEREIRSWGNWADPETAAFLISVLMPEEFSELYKSSHHDLAAHAVLLGHSVAPELKPHAEYVSAAAPEEPSLVDDDMKIIQIREILGYETPFNDEALHKALRSCKGDVSLVVDAALNGTLLSEVVAGPPLDAAGTAVTQGTGTAAARPAVEVGYSFQPPEPPAKARAMSTQEAALDPKLKNQVIKLAETQLVQEIRDAMRAGDAIDAPAEIREMIPGLRMTDDDFITDDVDDDGDEEKRFAASYNNWLVQQKAEPLKTVEEDEKQEDSQELGYAAANTGQEDLPQEEPPPKFPPPEQRKITNRRKKERMKGAVANHHRKDRRNRKLQQAMPPLF